MYAVIEDSGRQLKVSEGETLLVDLRDAAPGDRVEFDRVLLWSGPDGCRVGTPYLPQARVLALVEAEVKGPKVVSFKYRRRENYRRKVGHRQRYLRVRVTEIVVPDGPKG